MIHFLQVAFPPRRHSIAGELLLRKLLRRRSLLHHPLFSSFFLLLRGVYYGSSFYFVGGESCRGLRTPESRHSRCEIEGNLPMEPQSLTGSTKQEIGGTGFDGDESYDDGSVWGDLDDNPSKGSELDREWKSRREQFYNHGYREGISAGKNDSAQEGFNDGFKDSVLAGYNWGLVRGITSALAYLPEELRKKMVETEDKRREFKSLHESVCSISTEAALKVFYDNMSEKKASGELVDPETAVCDQQSGDQMSKSNVLGNHFQKLQQLLQNSPELEVGLEKKEKRKP